MADDNKDAGGARSPAGSPPGSKGGKDDDAKTRSAAGGAEPKKDDFTAAYKEDTKTEGDTRVAEIQDEDFPNKVMEGADGDKLLVVEFYGPRCPACKSMVEFYNLLSVNHPNQLFCKINVRENEEIAYAARIEFLPTFIYYKDAKEVDREVGTDAKAIEAKVNQYKSLIKPQPKAASSAGGKPAGPSRAPGGPPGGKPGGPPPPGGKPPGPGGPKPGGGPPPKPGGPPGAGPSKK